MLSTNSILLPGTLTLRPALVSGKHRDRKEREREKGSKDRSSRATDDYYGDRSDRYRDSGRGGERKMGLDRDKQRKLRELIEKEAEEQRREKSRVERLVAMPWGQWIC